MAAASRAQENKGNNMKKPPGGATVVQQQPQQLQPQALQPPLQPQAAGAAGAPARPFSNGVVPASSSEPRGAVASSGGPYPPPSAQYSDIPADFSKVDAILRHLRQTESQDWLGEIQHCCAQVCYLLLQNYSISRFNIHNYNFHLVMLTILFFAQRIWCSLWRLTQCTDAPGVRFACHMVLLMVLLDSLYCSMQLVIKDSITGALYLTAPVLGSVLYHSVYLKANTNVFTAELFGMLGRCSYHSMETAYCIGILPLRFLYYECIYYETDRCVILTILVTMHTFLSLLCLELHCLGSEVLQQARMLGEWRYIPDLSRLKVNSKPHEWSGHSCPYTRGAVVRCKDRFYEAMALLNTSSPACPNQCIQPIAHIFGDARRTKTMLLGALLILNAVLIHLMLWSNQWFIYAVMLIPNCGHFLYVKFRKSHSFFNPAHLNLRQLQWDLMMSPSYKQLSGNAARGLTPWGGGSSVGQDGGCWSGNSFTFGADGSPEDEMDRCHNNHRHQAEDASAGGIPHGATRSHFMEALLNSCPSGSMLQGLPNPLLTSAISASTMFFFGPSGTTRPPSETGSMSGGHRHEVDGGGRRDR